MGEQPVPEHVKILDSHMVEITRVLEPEGVLTYFMPGNLMTDDEIAGIRAQTTRHKRVVVFMDVLKRSSQGAFNVFVGALEKVHAHLACLLLRSEMNKVKEDLEKSRAVVVKKERVLQKFRSGLQPENKNTNEAAPSRVHNSQRASGHVEDETGGEENETSRLPEVTNLIQQLARKLNEASNQLTNLLGARGQDKADQLEETLSRLSDTTESFQARVSSSRGPRHKVTEENQSRQENDAAGQEGDVLRADEIQRLNESNEKSKDSVERINKEKQKLQRRIRDAGNRLSQDEANKLTAQLRGVRTVREEIDELKEKMKKMEKRLDEMTERLEAQSEKKKRITNERDKMKDKVAVMEKDWAPKTQMYSVKDDLEKSKTNVKELREQLRTEQDAHRDKRRELVNLKRQLQLNTKKTNEKQPAKKNVNKQESMME